MTNTLSIWWPARMAIIGLPEPEQAAKGARLEVCWADHDPQHLATMPSTERLACVHRALTLALRSVEDAIREAEPPGDRQGGRSPS